MKRKIVVLVAVLLMTASCDQSHLQQAQVPVTPSVSESDRALLTWAEGSEKQGDDKAPSAPATVQMDLPKQTELDGRKKLVPAIYATFARRTTPARAKWLSEICYEKTEGTIFTPLDLAEIALAETGGHKLSSRAVSSKGALGVWQLMPERAESHGFKPQDMWDDEKCAEAAVKELYEKLEMADGNKARAKRLYCGVGPAARAYDKIRKRFRAEILREMQRGMLMQVASNR